MWKFRRGTLIMALKLGLTLVVFVALFVVYTSSDKPSDDPHLQKVAAEKYSAERPKSSEREESAPTTCSNCDHSKEAIHLAVVACGDRMPETIILLKSAVMFSSSTLLHFHIFTEAELQPQFKEALESWPAFVKERFSFNIRSISYPESEDFEKWKVLFKPCASQRLFFPQILTEIDRLLYVDTDILFLKPVQDIWRLFSHFNSSQLAALAPEHEDKAMGWYNRFAMHPFYGELGVNSGVMLMHLDRMRASRWERKMIAYQQEYDKKIVWGDQDLINIYFHYFPEKLLLFSCQWNYRPDHCMYNQNCHSAVENGVSVLHGNRRVFHNEKQPAFKAVYNAVAEFDFEKGDPEKDLIQRVQIDLRALAKNYCAEHVNALIKSLSVSIKNIPKPA